MILYSERFLGARVRKKNKFAGVAKKFLLLRLLLPDSEIIFRKKFLITNPMKP